MVQDLDSADENQDGEGDVAIGDAVADGEVQMREPPKNQERQVHPRRFRLWGLAASPGDGCTAAVVSRYSTQHPNRRAQAEVMFGWHVPPETDDDREDAGAAGSNGGGAKAMPARATTEARIWEWLYGRGDEVPGTTDATDIIPLASSLSMLRDTFHHILSRIRCVFCDTGVTVKDAEAVCENGHAFGMFTIPLVPSLLIILDTIQK